MIGAVIGDIVGSRFEWQNLKSKEFELFTAKNRFTDDSVMTMAVAQAILDCGGDYSKLPEAAVRCRCCVAAAGGRRTVLRADGGGGRPSAVPEELGLFLTQELCVAVSRAEQSERS